MPLNIAAHDHLTLMQATVVSWVRLVCEERDLRGPVRNDLSVLTTWLFSHLPWLLEHPADGDLADEMRDLSSTADALAQSTRQPTRAGADCFDCGGHLLRRITGDGLEEDHVTCTVCHVQYEPSRYMLALKAAAWDAARVVRDGEAWATPASLAHDLGRSEVTIRSWQLREQVRSRRIGGIVFVNVADVEDRHSPKGETA
ncbi:MAG: hypothetical protein H7233_15910 [Pseudorhodobacter sp.]|nr:hypothetical protein [Frankiaceae bacterium]